MRRADFYNAKNPDRAVNKWISTNSVPSGTKFP